MSSAIAVYQVLSFPGPCLFCTIQKVGKFHATHAIMSIYNYLASSFFPDACSCMLFKQCNQTNLDQLQPVAQVIPLKNSHNFKPILRRNGPELHELMLCFLFACLHMLFLCVDAYF